MNVQVHQYHVYSFIWESQPDKLVLKVNHIKLVGHGISYSLQFHAKKTEMVSTKWVYTISLYIAKARLD